MAATKPAGPAKLTPAELQAEANGSIGAPSTGIPTSQTTHDWGILGKAIGSTFIPGAATLLGVAGHLNGQQALNTFTALAKRDPGAFAQIQQAMHDAGLYGTTKTSINYGVVSASDVAAFIKVIRNIGSTGNDVNQWVQEQGEYNKVTGAGTAVNAATAPEKVNIDTPATLNKAIMSAFEQVQGRMPTASEMAAFTSSVQSAQNQAGVTAFQATARYQKQLVAQQQAAALASGGDATNANSNWLAPQSVTKPPALSPTGTPLPGNGAGSIGVLALPPDPTHNTSGILPGSSTAGATAPVVPSNAPSWQSGADQGAGVKVASSNAGSGSAAAIGSKSKNPTGPDASGGRYIDPTSAMKFSQQTATVWGMRVSSTQHIPVGKQDVTSVTFNAQDDKTAQEFYTSAEQNTGKAALYTSVKRSGNTITVTYAKNAGSLAQNAISDLGKEMANQSGDPANVNKTPDQETIDEPAVDADTAAWQKAWNADPNNAEATQNAPAADQAIEKSIAGPGGPQNNPTAGVA